MMAAGLSFSISPARAAATSLKIAATNAVNDGGIGAVGPVSCASGVCVAGGGQEVSGPQSPGGTLTMTVPTGALNFSPSNGSVDGISCVSSTTCIAVGQQYLQPGQTQMFTIVNGAVATVTASTDPFLSSVACVSSSLCYAVGQQSTSVNSEVVPLTVGAGGVTAGVGSPVGMTILDIVCPSATTCYGAGDNGGTSAAVVTITNGVSGTPVPGTPVTVPGVEVLSGIACSSPTSCVAVGQSTPTGGAEVTVTNGIPGPAVTDAHASLLSAVACPTADCIAVGEASPSFAGGTTSEGYIATTQSQQDLATTSVTIFGAIACSNGTACYGTGPTASPGTNAIVTINDGVGLSVSKAVATATGLSSGPVAGNTPITITGTGFGNPGDSDAVNLVPSGGGTPIAATGVVVQSDTTITAVTGDATAALPAGQASLVTDVEVTAGGQTSPANPTDDEFTYESIQVTQVTATMPVLGTSNTHTVASMGPVIGGEPLQIFGSGFTGATEVDFVDPTGAVAATALPQVASDGEIDLAHAPDLTGAVNAAGGLADMTFDVIVKVSTQSSSVSSGDRFTAKVPVVTAVSPTTGPLAGRETVAVTGQWFSGADLIAFSAIGGDTATQSVEAPLTGPITADPANPFVPEDNQLMFTAPDATAMFSSGFTGLRQAHTIVDVPVSNSSAAITSSPGTADVFSFPSVEVTDLSEHTDNVLGGDTITVSGHGFTGATQVLLVHHEGKPGGAVNTDVPIPVTPTSDSQISFAAPDETANMFNTGTGGVFQNVVTDVEVSVPQPSGPPVVSPADPTSDLLTFVVPSVTGVTPHQGPAGGGTTLTIGGLGLSGVTNVRFQVESGGQVETTAVVISDKLAQAISPPAGVLGASGQDVATDVETVTPVTTAPKTDFIVSTANANVDSFTFQAPLSAPPCGTLNNCNGATNSDPNGSAGATSTTPTGSITATGKGVGGITVGRYSSNPVGAPSFDAAGSYFDVSVSSPNTFTSATIQDCDLQGGTSAQWWDPAANAGAGGWQPVTPETLSAGPPPCLTITLSATSSPTLAQLTGTVFAIALPSTGTAKASVDLDTSTHDAKPGNTVTLHATISGAHHKPKPTGTLSFTDDGAAITGCMDRALPASGTLTCKLSYSSTAGSPHWIVASYSGDPTYEPAMAGTTIRVTKVRTDLRLDASKDRVTAGQRLTYRATIVADGRDSPSPTGTVTFTDDGVAIPGCSSVTLNRNGPTTCAVTAIKGTHHVKAVYSGDNVYAGSSGTLTETVKSSGRT